MEISHCAYYVYIVKNRYLVMLLGTSRPPVMYYVIVFFAVKTSIHNVR